MGLKILIVFCFFSVFAFSQTLDQYRQNLSLAASNKNVCKSMLLLLEKKNLNAINRAYLGTYQTIWANHVFGPIAKWNTFSTGKKNIEQAVLMDADAVEIRALRYAVQKNAPKFLGYYSSLSADKAYILERKHTLADLGLLQLVKSLNL